MVLDRLQYAKVLTSRMFPNGHYEAVLDLSTPDDVRAGRDRSPIRVIMPADMQEPLIYGRIKCEKDYASEIDDNPHFVPNRSLSKKLIERIKQQFPLENDEQVDFLDVFSRRVQPKSSEQPASRFSVYA